MYGSSGSCGLPLGESKPTKPKKQKSWPMYGDNRSSSPTDAFFTKPLQANGNKYDTTPVASSLSSIALSSPSSSLPVIDNLVSSTAPPASSASRPPAVSSTCSSSVARSFSSRRNLRQPQYTGRWSRPTIERRIAEICQQLQQTSFAFRSTSSLSNSLTAAASSSLTASASSAAPVPNSGDRRPVASTTRRRRLRVRLAQLYQALEGKREVGGQKLPVEENKSRSLRDRKCRRKTTTVSSFRKGKTEVAKNHCKLQREGKFKRDGKEKEGALADRIPTTVERNKKSISSSSSQKKGKSGAVVSCPLPTSSSPAQGSRPSSANSLKPAPVVPGDGSTANRKKTCLRCRKYGHVLKECKIELFDPSAASGSPQQEFPSQSNNTRTAGYTGVCFNCGNSGHALRDCRKPRKPGGDLPFALCFLCNETGHLAATCVKNSTGVYPLGGSCLRCGSIYHLVANCPSPPGERTRNECRRKGREQAAGWTAAATRATGDTDDWMEGTYACTAQSDTETKKRSRKKGWRGEGAKPFRGGRKLHSLKKQKRH